MTLARAVISLVVATAALAPVAASAGSFDDKAPIATMTPLQQWDSKLGLYQTTFAAQLLVADELGDRLAQLGHVAVVELCLQHKEGAERALEWAACRDDLDAIDLAKVAAEFRAAKYDEAYIKRTMERIKDSLARARALGDQVEATAKSDPGVAEILRVATAARAEWATYAAAHQAEFEFYRAARDAVRAGDRTAKVFEGCYETTQPVFAKIVKAAKLPLAVDDHPLETYVRLVAQTREGYLAAVNYGACAWSQGAGGAGMFVAAANMPAGLAVAGPRTNVLAKLYAPSFAPKFVSPGLSIRNMRQRSQNVFPTLNELLSIMTPNDGIVAKVTPAGDTTTVTYRDGSTEACLEWADTKKVVGVRNNGDFIYDKVCRRRGRVEDTATDNHFLSRYMGGVVAGAEVLSVKDWVVTVQKGGKLIGALGVSLR